MDGKTKKNKSENTWARTLLSSKDREAITQKVKDFEKKTSIEIVPVFCRGSSTVSHVFPLLGILSFTVFTCMLLIFFPFQSGRVIIAIAAFASFLVAWVLSARMFFQRLLTSKQDRIYQVRQRAELEFYRQQLNQTPGRTGILVFVSWMEKQAVILGDRAISERFEKGFWDEVVSKMVQRFKSRQVRQAFEDAIDFSSQHAAESFPTQDDQRDHLKNSLVIVDY